MQSAVRIKGHNDIYPDCVFVAACNAARTVFARCGIEDKITEDTPLQLHEQLGGLVPGEPSTYKGYDPEKFFDWWLSNDICGAKLHSVARIDNTDINEVRRVIVAMGGVFYVFNMSVDQQNQTVWMPTGIPGTWDEHAAWGDQYTGNLNWATTWGEGKPIHKLYVTSPKFTLAAYELLIDVG